MKTAVVAGGPYQGADKLKCILEDCDRIIACDSGADIVVSLGLVPEKVIGDLDSIDESVKAHLQDLGIPFEVYPVEKDMTDSELGLTEASSDAEVIFVCPLRGRIDHVLSNIELAVRLHEEGMNITVTDGVSDLIPLSGPDEVTVSGLTDPESVTVSLIPFTPVTGVTSEGLYYKLENASVKPGSSLTVSNKPEQGGNSFTISVNSGNMGVLIIPTE